jgi:hypothetical protein
MSISSVRPLSSSVHFYPADTVLLVNAFLLRLRAVKLRPCCVCADMEKKNNFLIIFYFILFFPSERMQNLIYLFIWFIYFFHIHTDASWVRIASTWTRAGSTPHPHERKLGPHRVRTDAPGSSQTHARVRAEAAIYPRVNFKMDAIVHLSHGRPGSHRPRPSTWQPYTQVLLSQHPLWHQ